MKKLVVLVLLVLLAMTGAVLEGLVENLSPHLVQLNGLLTIVCTAALIIWTLKIQADSFREH